MDQVKTSPQRDIRTLGPIEIDKIYHGDAIQLLPKLPDASIDLVLTDPPFAIDFKGRRTNYNRTAQRVIEGYSEIPMERYGEFSRKWITEVFRVLKSSGSAYIFSGWTNLKDILIAIDDAGFTTLNHLIWKYQFGVFTRKKFVTSHYHILLVVKDIKSYKFNKIDHYPEDVFIINREYWTGRKKTATKLPIDLVKKLILYSTDPGDIVLDPFLGSGTTAVAALQLSRHYIGFEIVKDYVKFAEERIKKESSTLFR